MGQLHISRFYLYINLLAFCRHLHFGCVEIDFFLFDFFLFNRMVVMHYGKESLLFSTFLACKYIESFHDLVGVFVRFSV